VNRLACIAVRPSCYRERARRDQRAAPALRAARAGVCAALGILLCAGALRASAADEAVQLLQVLSPDTLLVEAPSGAQRVRLRGVHADPFCRVEAHLAWSRHLLRPGMPLELAPADAAGLQSVRFEWHGSPLDLGFVLLRAGQALPGALPEDDTKVPAAYTWAARAARAEGRGLWGECGRSLARFRRAGAAYGIPAEILYGIAMVESRHGDGPWPWTLNVAGQPYFFLSREAAWDQMRVLEAQHFDLVDVGFMQVNWRYHHHRFRNSWEALDPDTNQRVAVEILDEYRRSTGSLGRAIARYHSARADAGEAYLRRVAAAAVQIRALSEDAP
jgi:hypothetical protein